MSAVQYPEKVILLHGIGQPALMLFWLDWRLRQFGFNTWNLSYPSRKLGLDGCADYLRSKIGHYPENSISFVAHSMGGIVLRKYIQKYGENQIQRIVMLGPPNQGSLLAYRLRNFPLYKLYYGPAGMELADKNQIQSLPIPKSDLMIIAGHCGFRYGFNPLLPCDNDFFVALDETMLPGAKEFIKIKNFHGLLVNSPHSVRIIRNFLLTGRSS